MLDARCDREAWKSDNDSADGHFHNTSDGGDRVDGDLHRSAKRYWFDAATEQTLLDLHDEALLRIR